jgi:hypothetical protein
MPERIQRERTSGWRMPPNAVYVGRPTRWGNPFKVSDVTSLNQNWKQAEAVERFREWLSSQDGLQAAVRKELAGKDLACWCRLDLPCHADVLLEVANA